MRAFFPGTARRAYIAGCFWITAARGGMLILFGEKGPFGFALSFLPISVFGSGVRPPTTMLMRSRLDSDNGAVASLVGSAGLLFGSLSMLLCSLPWPNFILASGAISLGVGVFCASGWLWLDRDRKYSGKATV